MRRKRTGGKNSAYRREKAIMTASVVLVLAAMTVTGISVYRNHQKSQEEEQHIVDFSKLEEETQSLTSARSAGQNQNAVADALQNCLPLQLVQHQSLLLLNLIHPF